MLETLNLKIVFGVESTEIRSGHVIRQKSSAVELYVPEDGFGTVSIQAFPNNRLRIFKITTFNVFALPWVVHQQHATRNEQMFRSP